jgi:hypothetical protein
MYDFVIHINELPASIGTVLNETFLQIIDKGKV